MATGTAGTQAFQLPISATHVKFVDITYLDTTAVNLALLPLGATLLRIYAHVTTAFNDSGTDLIKVQRSSGGSDGEMASIDGSTAGVVLGTALATAASAVARPAADQQITVKYVGQNSNANAGAARVIVEFIAPVC